LPVFFPLTPMFSWDVSTIRTRLAAIDHSLSVCVFVCGERDPVLRLRRPEAMLVTVAVAVLCSKAQS
jgi:hypothetical protein